MNWGPDNAVAKFPICLDYHATTPVDPRAVEAMLPFFTDRFGNPASRTHAYGWDAEEAVESAREEVAALIGARHHEIVFTSGATESNNLAIKGVLRAAGHERPHLVTLVTEHSSILASASALEREGFEVTRLGVRPDGLADLDALRAAVTDRTALVSVMAANNEIGVLQPLGEIARIAHDRGALVHTDAAQAAGKIPLDVRALDLDLLSFTSHKMYGPKGIGALYVRRRTPRLELVPLIDGGGHEGGLRSGTLNVPAIVGFGKAAAIARSEMPTESARLAGLRDRLLERLAGAIPDLRVNGALTPRLPHNLNVSIPGVDGQKLMLGLSDLAVSSGSACTSAAAKASHVLAALGVSDELAGATIRFGLGRWTTADEVERAADCVIGVVSSLRERRTALGA